MKKKKYEVTEDGEGSQEEFICNRIPHTHCKCQKIIIIIFIIPPLPQWIDSRHWALTSAVLGLLTFLYCANLLPLLTFSSNKQFLQTMPSHLSHSLSTTLLL